MIARLPLPALAVVLATVCASAFAQNPSPGAPPAPTATPPVPMVQGTPEAMVPEAKVEHLVTEDSQVRIEETRVRGIPTRIVVHSKIRGMGSYGIQPRDPSKVPQDFSSAGQPSLSFGF
jgi:hypothetical protein